ncbi:MAG: Rpn family recombination-promoting nuclease/putative transposase [Deltaproteobacteria bacterium]|jgi:hypothetical protein|nr:Rpn family recombination-promoting nuclease/putative transposase [Deltaproteobacteria bacterium]
MELKFNKNIKDSVFRNFFRVEQRALEIFNALNNTSYSDKSIINFNILDDTVLKNRFNDISFIADNKVVVLIEHQSIINKNIPLRFLLYLTRIYEIFISKLTAGTIYKSKIINLPTPQLAVFYNGDEDIDNISELRLSDAFICRDSSFLVTNNKELNTVIESTFKDPYFPLDVVVKVYNINKGYNLDFVNKSNSLREYVEFIALLKINIKLKNTLEEAISTTITECIKKNIMKEFFLSHPAEELTMWLETEYDFNTHLAVRFEEGREEGVKKVALNLLKKGSSVSFVVETTGLAEEVVKKMKENLGDIGPF